MAVTMSMEELANATGVDLGASAWIDVTQEAIDQFADATDDHQWIHVDRDRASDGPFGQTIAHGFWTIAMIPRLLADMLEVPDSSMGVNYGSDRLRLTAPVPVGSRIRAVATLDEVEEKAGGLLMHVEATIEIEGADRPALVGTFLLLRT